MCADINSRLREYANHLDRTVPHVTADEVTGSLSGEADQGQHAYRTLAPLRHRSIRPLTVAASFLVVLLVAALVVRGSLLETSSSTATVPSPRTLPEPAQGRTDQQFAGTEEALPTFPMVWTSEESPSATGYGLAGCSGSATMYAALVSRSSVVHQFAGTLCPIVHLDFPETPSVALCSSLTEETQYATCLQLSTEDPSDTPTVTSFETGVPFVEALPAPTKSSERPLFSAEAQALRNPSREVDYQDSRIAVSVSQAGDVVHVAVRLPDATVDSVVGTLTLQTGLVYGAFQSGSDDAIDVIGVVPDDVVAVTVAGSVVPIQNNVWHYVARVGESLSIEVSGVDDRQVVSL